MTITQTPQIQLPHRPTTAFYMDVADASGTFDGVADRIIHDPNTGAFTVHKGTWDAKTNKSTFEQAGTTYTRLIDAKIDGDRNGAADNGLFISIKSGEVWHDYYATSSNTVMTLSKHTERDLNGDKRPEIIINPAIETGELTAQDKIDAQLITNYKIFYQIASSDGLLAYRGNEKLD